MKIQGESKPITNKEYSYTLISDTGKSVFVYEWEIQRDGKSLKLSAPGKFRFGLSLAGKSVVLIAKTWQNNKKKNYSITLQVLKGIPRIKELKWLDINNESLEGRQVAYLDNVKLEIKTENIPIGETLKITIYEDEYATGHGKSSRNMGTYTSTAVNKYGYSFLNFTNIKLYRNRLNDMDYGNENYHEFYAQVVYQSHIDKIEDRKQLVVQNSLHQMVKPYSTNKPVVIGKADSVEKEVKRKRDYTFGVFLDGTLNNMYNTEIRQLAEGKKPKNTSGLALSEEEAKELYARNKFMKNMERSYQNDLSNPAILYKNYSKNDISVFKIYTEGIGTYTAPKEQGGDLTKDDYVRDDDVAGPAFGMGKSGIMNNVRKAIRDVVSVLQKTEFNQYIGTITFDIFGFSRGAAAARHFVHLVTHPAYNPRVKESIPLDLQGCQVPLYYFNKTMPRFGLLGQLLQESDRLHVETDVKVRFVGIYDTVPHHGLFQADDISVLGLDNVNKADYVVHMVAADEHRTNFSLVDISSVTKTSPDSGKKGGIELIYPGVHCDVGGAYEEGRPDHQPKLDKVIFSKSKLESLRKELIRQGWFKTDELLVKFDGWKVLDPTKEFFRLEGYRKQISNQYSYIPLHIMTEFALKKKLPINKTMILDYYMFKPNFIDKLPPYTYESDLLNKIPFDNVSFLNRIKKRLVDYSFHGAKPLIFEEPKIYSSFIEGGSESDSILEERVKRELREEQKKFDILNMDIKFLRNHYLHWNSWYGYEDFVDEIMHVYRPNIVNGKRKRHVR